MVKNNLLLNEELKNYLNFKDKLKNDHPLKYWFLNTNLFIHISFWIWAIWSIWVIFAFVSPTNNTHLIQDYKTEVIFESAFSYVYKIFNSGGNLSNSVKFSKTIWFADANFFLVLTITLFFLTIYTFGLVKNFLFDLKNIFHAHKLKQLIWKRKCFSFLFTLIILISLGNLAWTSFALVYVPGFDTTTEPVIQTLLFAPTKNISKSYSLPLTFLGFCTLLINLGITIINFNLYYSYCYEKYNHNHFFFQEARDFTYTKEDKKLKKLNVSINKKSKGFFKNKTFFVPNTKGYFAELTNVSKIFYVNNKPFFALNDVTLNVKKGEFIVILGPSGSGKTTLVNVLSGIDKPTKGKIVVSNCDTMQMNDYELNIFRRENIGYVFQHFALLPNLTAWENVDIVNSLNNKVKELTIKNLREKWSSFNTKKEKINECIKWVFKSIFEAKRDNHVDEVLEILNLSAHANKYPHQLSGGQQQRVAIARSLIKKPKILFGDEITGALDSNTAKTILELFYLINKYSKTTVILITHNPVIAEIADRVLYVKNGKIDRDVINKNPKKIHELKNL